MKRTPYKPSQAEKVMERLDKAFNDYYLATERTSYRQWEQLAKKCIAKMRRILAVKKCLIAAAALVFAGCDRPQSEEKHIVCASYSVRTVEVKGHEYIIYEGNYKGNIIHSESCPCKKGGAR